MDVGDHSKIQAPVHVCQKCGWSFPNSHPSAKHRRAHKKLCGTLEGYRLFESNDSDDGSHSDEDHKTSSPKLLERSINEKGSFGIGDRSNRSEDEVFTDAAAEFSDGSGLSPGGEEHFVEAIKSVSNMERVANYDITSNQYVNDIAIIGPSSSNDKYQMKNDKVPEYKTDQSESILQHEDDMAAVQLMVNMVSGRTAEESVVGLSSDSNSPLYTSYSIEYEKPADDTLHESETKADEAVTERSSKVLEQGNFLRGNPEVKFDSVSEDIVRERSLTEMTEVAPKLETKEQDALSADEVFQSKEENTEGLNPKMSTSGSYAEMEPVKRPDDSSDIVQINVVIAQAADSNSSSYIGEGSDEKDGNESVNVFSVPEDVNIVAHPEIMLEGFKGHKGLKLHQPEPLDSCETIEDKEANLKSLSCEENSSGFQSKQLSEVSGVTSSAVPVLEDNLEGRGYKLAVEEVPFEGEVGLSRAMVSVDENSQSDVGVPAYAAALEVKNNCTTSYGKEEIPCDVFRDCLQRSFSDDDIEVAPDVNFMETSLGAKVNEITSLVDKAEAGNEKLDMAGNENSEEVSGDNTSENTAKTGESLSNISEFQVNPGKGQSFGDEEKYGVSENRGSGRPLEANVLMNKKSVPELACNLQDSLVAAGDVTDGSNDKVSEIGVADSRRVDIDASEDKIPASNTIREVCVDRVSIPSESHQGEDFETFQKTSEYHIVEEKAGLTRISASVEEIGRGASRIGSEISQAEGDNNTATQQFAAADVSIDSCSQTDSLEAHWGSVSVFSTQSDVPTGIDAESLLSTDSLFPAETANLRKPKVEAQEQCYDRSDVCEPPCLLALAETRQKDDSSDIQKAQQSISASPRAGWFPSLTNVVNDSPGRKKNEEFIAKVTNLSSGKQHMPLKSVTSLETKPKSPSPEESPIVEVGQKDETEGKGNSGQAITVNSILGSESPAAAAAAESGKERAKYTSEIKREKGKVKGRPLWAPFVCCYSVNHQHQD